MRPLRAPNLKQGTDIEPSRSFAEWRSLPDPSQEGRFRVIKSLRISSLTRWTATLLTVTMCVYLAMMPAPVRAQDTTAPATTAPDQTTTTGDQGATPDQTTTPAPAPAVVPAIPIPLSSITSVLLLPVVNKPGAAYAAGASALGTAIKLKINAVGRFNATSYEPYMPAIQRAFNVEDTLSTADLTPPFDTPERARKIAKVVGTDGFAIISLDTEDVDPSTGKISIGATLSLYATAYGDPIFQNTATGASAPTSASEPQATVENRAIQAAASKLVAPLGAGGFGSNAPGLPTIGNGHHSNSGSILLVILAGVMVGVLVNASHSGHNTTSSTVVSGLPGSGTSSTGGSSTSGGSSSSPPGSPSLP